jgi:hypothetical protein
LDGSSTPLDGLAENDGLAKDGLAENDGLAKDGSIGIGIASILLDELALLDGLAALARVGLIEEGLGLMEEGLTESAEDDAI